MTDTETILRLTATLRQQDQLIYNMSQCSSWEEMRPFFMELFDGTQRRMKEESDRIRLMLVPEIVRTYAKPQATPSTEPQRPRLEGPRDAGGVAPLRHLDRPDKDDGNPPLGGPADGEGNLP
jgi:hypothetical protein